MAKNGTEVEVTKYPECDVHKYNYRESGIEAHYDARTLNGQWGNLCDDCFKTHTSGELGTGKGQRLILAKS